MFTINSGSGSVGFTLLGPSMSDERARLLKVNIEKILRTRGHDFDANILASYPFRFRDGTNDFGDEFTVLVATLPLRRYEDLRKIAQDPKNRRAFHHIEDVAMELGV